MSKEKLRYEEYYDVQKTFDWLYECSVEDKMKGIDLYDIIKSSNNIRLAYRMIKTNTGSKTKGTDNKTIEDYKIVNEENYLNIIRKRLEKYVPQSVRRVEIPKKNGKKRPLGIPTMEDRLIQQMFKQVMEPICEAKFYKHSYGFRANRNVEHVIARCNTVMYQCKCHYVVDIDIKGFFDNVNHRRLIKQLYNIGVKDKRVLTIISKMLKAPIKTIGIPTKGTPQGGILSPLLSNVVLNELDWWIANQWETYKTRYQYSNDGKKHRAMKTTGLKEMHIVRYADDFKIFTNNYKDAIKIYQGVKSYIEKRLKLEISEEKSSITNLRRRYSKFLGFEIKVKKKGTKYVSTSRIAKDRKENIKEEVKAMVKVIQRNPTVKHTIHFNMYVLGIQNYFKKATQISQDMSDIAFACLPIMYNRFKSIGRYKIPRSPPWTYQRLYEGYNCRAFEISGVVLYPISCVKWHRLEVFNPEKCDYTKEGREQQIKPLKYQVQIEIRKMMKESTNEQNMEYLDNRISRYSMQRGKCAILNQFINGKEVYCHHKIPKALGGSDKFDNLIIVHEMIHKLIEETDTKTIKKYIKDLKINEKQIVKLNKLRKLCKLTDIYLE